MEGQPEIVRLLIVFNPQPQAEPIDTKWADSGAAFARRCRYVPTERVKQLGAALVEVAKPVPLEVAERVWLGGSEVGRGEPGNAFGVGKHCEHRLQPEQPGSVPDVEEPFVAALRGQLQGDPPGWLGVQRT